MGTRFYPNYPIHQPSWLQRVRLFFRHARSMLGHQTGRYRVDDVVAIQDALDGRRFVKWARDLRNDAATNFTTSFGRRLSELPVDEIARKSPYSVAAKLVDYYTKNRIDPGEPAFARIYCHWDDESDALKIRYRELHDLRHVLLGLGVSPPEEVLVHAFQWGQTPTWVSAAIVLGGFFVLSNRPALARSSWNAFWLGRRSVSIWKIDLTRTLHQSLAQARDELCIDRWGASLWSNRNSDGVGS